MTSAPSSANGTLRQMPQDSGGFAESHAFCGNRHNPMRAAASAHTAPVSARMCQPIGAVFQYGKE